MLSAVMESKAAGEERLVGWGGALSQRGLVSHSPSVPEHLPVC